MKCLICFSLICFNQLFTESSLIQSIVLMENVESIDENLQSENPIDIYIPCAKEQLEACLSPYLGQSISEENLQKIKENISKYLIVHGDSLHLVQIPEQKILGGRVFIIVLPARVDQVTVSDNRWFSSNAIINNMSISNGDIVQEKELLNSTAWLNRNPFIHVDNVLSPGEEKGETDLDILARDRFPVRFYAGTDNTGNSFSGNERFYTGVNLSLGLRNLLTYQFTFGYDFPEFLSHFGNWAIFLPWKHELIFYGGYATLHPNIDDFDSKGTDVQVSMRYSIPFKPLYVPFQNQLLWGADYKQIDSSLFFLGALPDGTFSLVPVNQKTADLFQFYLGYQLKNSWNKFDLTFKVEGFFSPFKFLPRQKKSDYNSLREGAEVRYFYNRTAFGINYQLPMKFVFASLLRGQIASGALLPSEQFGLGGYDTVRGYQERVFLADNAVIGNFEIRTPTVSFFQKKIDEFTFLAFIDTAYGYNWKTSAAFSTDAWLMGVGSGVRYQILPYLVTRLDYGFRIHNTNFGNAQIGRVHFSLTLGY